MTTAPLTNDEREEIELLLPWFVTGKLDAADRAKVEAAIARDPALRRQIDLAREEIDVTFTANEAVALPHTLSVESGMQAVAANTSLGVRQAAGGLTERIREFFAMPTAGAVKWATAAAAAIILLQAVTIGTLLPRGDGYQTASGGGALTGTTAIVKFVDGAKASDIAAELAKRGMAIVDGPKPGGTFVVRLSPQKLTAADRTARINDLKAASGIVGTVLP